MTATDVALVAEVSRSAVSRAFTLGASVAPKTRSKILAAAKRLGYRPNAIARSLATRRLHLVGLLAADFGNPFYLPVLGLMTERLEARGLRALLLNVSGVDDLRDAVALVVQYQVDALIAISAVPSPELLRECRRNRLPVVLFSRYAKRPKTASVTCDDVAGGRLIADLFAERGYRRPAFISGGDRLATSIDRENGFREGLQARGLAVIARAGGTYSYAAGAEAARCLLAARDRPDAIFCANDLLALGAMDVARYELNIAIPDQLGIAGFDDIPIASYPTYSLTTIRHPIEPMVDNAIQLAVDAIDDPSRRPVVQILPPALVERGSTRPLAARRRAP